MSVQLSVHAYSVMDYDVTGHKVDDIHVSLKKKKPARWLNSALLCITIVTTAVQPTIHVFMFDEDLLTI